MSVGVALLGAGAVAELHVQALADQPDARLVGVHDADAAKAAARAATWGCVDYPDVVSLLADPRVDAVLVLTPFETHEELAVAALRAGKHVLVEKPVADVTGTLALRQAAREADRVCLPGHNYAYQPEFTALRTLVRDGSLGEVRAAWITYAIEHAEEVAARYGSVLDTVLVHHTYLALSLFGPPSRVHVGRLDPVWSAHPESDQAWMVWDYRGRRSVHLFASFSVGDDTSNPWTFVVKALGTRGGATYSWRDRIFRRPLGTLPVALPAYEDTYRHEQAAFLRAIGGDSAAVASPLDDALTAAQILDQCRAALADGRSDFAFVTEEGHR